MEHDDKVLREQFASRVKALTTRHNLQDDQGAALMGVPVHTYTKWRTVQRTPNASAMRVLQLLELMDAMASDLFGALLSEINHDQ